MSSFGFAASTFGPKVLLVDFRCVELAACGPRQYVKAPDDAPMLLSILLQNGFLAELAYAAARVGVELCSKTPPAKATMRVHITSTDRTALLVSNLLLLKTPPESSIFL